MKSPGFWMTLKPHWGIIIDAIQRALQTSQRTNTACAFLMEANLLAPVADNFKDKPVGLFLCE
jgi:hypothetical protein